MLNRAVSVVVCSIVLKVDRMYFKAFGGGIFAF